MKRITLAICVIFFIFTSTAIADNLTQSIDKIIAKNLPRADVGVMVIDAKTGKTVYEHNSFQPFTPASNVKLFTAAAALLYLKPNYVYETKVSINPKLLKKYTLNSNLYLTFNGDPSLSIKDLKNLITEVNHYGITKITGNIVIDNTRFKPPYHAPGISYNDVNWYYAAPITTIIIDGNSVGLTLIPSNTLGKNARAKFGDQSNIFKLQANVKTVTMKEANNHCRLNVNVSTNNNIKLSGCWPIGKTAWLMVAIKNPLIYAKKILRRQLEKLHIKLEGTIVVGGAPKNLKIIARHYSPNLKYLVTRMLKDSDNIYAEAITKTLGSDYAGVGTFQEGANAIKSILKKHTNIDFNQLNLVDGAGTRFNLISPRQITKLLYVIYHNPTLKPILLSALPDAGRDGTLTHRFRAFDSSNNIRAKTGSMHDVSALSGILTTQNNKPYIFSIIINHVVGKIADAKDLENKICSALVRS